MKHLFSLIALSLFALSSAQAETITGTMKKISGRTVETGRPYTYYALVTEKGLRWKLPTWVNSRALAAKGALIGVEGRTEPMMCTDMSAACATGHVTAIRNLVITLDRTLSGRGMNLFSGPVVLVKGRAVESARTYAYYAIDSVQGEKVAVPSFLKASVLVKRGARIEVTGSVAAMACTDMSDACGPLEMPYLQGVSIRF